MCIKVRGHCLASLDPLGITRVRLGDEVDVRSRLLATCKYQQVYHLGKSLSTSRLHLLIAYSVNRGSVLLLCSFACLFVS